MKWFVIVLFSMLALSVPALAMENQGISTTDIAESWEALSPVEQAQMATLLAQKAAESRTPKVPSVDKVEPWLKLVDTLGSSLVKLAHDLGVEANELVKTPVGMMAMGLIAYHVMGDEVLDVFFSLIWFLLTFPLLILFFFKAVVPIQSYEKMEVVRWGKMKEVMRPVRRKPVFGDSEDFNVDWVFVVLVALNTIITLCIMA